MVRALVGSWPLVAGEIRLDEALQQHYSEEQRGTFIGYLPQGLELLEGTVAQNISRFSDGADNQIIAAARLAGAHEMILGLSDGYQTQVGDRGALLSAGQRQRVGLARAVFAEPFVVFLDEPNSNLDSDGDRALGSTIRNLRQLNRIVIVVAHRPSALAEVDKVLFIEPTGGCIVGSKAEILAQRTRPENSVSS